MRKKQNNTKTRIKRILIVAAMIAFGYHYGPKFSEMLPGAVEISSYFRELVFPNGTYVDEERTLEGPFKVLWVSDGDTIGVDYNGQDLYVRFIGIDTPESVNPDESKNTPEGKIASDYTKSIMTEEVYLEFDMDKFDDYGRLLAYVYLPNGTFLNEKIIRDGYAYTMNIAPNTKYQTVFLEAFAYARENKLGLWAQEEQ
ncbi:MAG: thermonuclease family protein [Parasporobacterium sp.]|nr:thermonuclease family protein [Parasporobacterium sp.]